MQSQMVFFLMSHYLNNLTHVKDWKS